MVARKDPFAAHVTASAKSAKSSSTEIAAALGALVTARLRKRQRTTQQNSSDSFASRVHNAQAAMPRIGKRRVPRRLGRIRFYEVTSKPDVSRYGTFRRYMITTIRKHTDTASAQREHDQCDEPKFAKNKLDFNWAADNGYINWK